MSQGSIQHIVAQDSIRVRKKLPSRRLHAALLMAAYRSTVLVTMDQLPSADIEIRDLVRQLLQICGVTFRQQ
jgi:hypothetical protein